MKNIITTLLIAVFLLPFETKAFDIVGLQNDYLSKETSLFESFAAEVDTVLLERKMTDASVISEVLDEKLRLFLADVDDLKRSIKLLARKDVDATFSDLDTLDLFVDRSSGILLRRVQLAIFLALEADAELEKARTMVPLLIAINTELDYARAGFTETRKAMAQFEAHYSCYCAQCNN